MSYDPMILNLGDQGVSRRAEGAVRSVFIY